MRLSCLIIFLFISIAASSQTRTAYGTVRDDASGEYLIGAYVVDTLTGQGVATNHYGFFSVPLSGNTVLRISYVGYETLVLDTFATFPLDLRLQPTELDNVIVREKRRLSVPTGYLQIPIQQIKSMPSLMGEADILKALSLTPGVSAGMDGSAGIYVRGGTPDQTLMLLDDVPVYNVTHLAGFFSVFNPNSIKSVELYKGAFPARFGGRLAAVTELTMREGNNQKFSGEVGLGLLNQNLTLEGPLLKNKASFIISGRVSTLGITELLQFNRKKESGEAFRYNFYDLNAKVNFQLSNKDQLFLSFYGGNDKFSYTEWRGRNTDHDSETLAGNYWGNRTASLRYNRIMSEKLFARATLIYSFYDSAFENRMEENTPAEQSHFFRRTRASVEDMGGKFHLEYFPTPGFRVKAGADLIQHYFRPFISETNYTIESPAASRTRFQAFQADAYIDADIHLTEKIQMNAGLRYSSYLLKDRSFYNPEPRIGLTWQLPANWTAKGGYSIMNQYLHLLSNTTAGFGFDAWLPATSLAVPSRAEQFSVGIVKNWEKHGLELSLEGYVKSMNHLIDYPEGTSFTDMLADSWEQIISKNGMGRAKGIELMLRKDTGKLNGWISYTLSNSERKFEDINGGAWFPMKYDRRHNLSVTGALTLSPKWKISSTFVYQTGHAVTLPDAAYIITGDPSNTLRFVYSQRNSGRMPDYHRLDIGATRTITTAKGNTRQLNIGFYNVYNRSNPLYLDFKPVWQNGNVTSIQTKQYSLFPVLPYINYSIKF